MAVKGEAAPVCDVMSHMQGRTFGFFFAKTLSPKAFRHFHQNARPMISFMISFVPP